MLLIDEVESLAGSRATASARNEVHDAVRATNALLTGFDMVRNNANILIISTSNLNTALDSAFTDRCSRQIVISPPLAAARYEILRRGITELVLRGVIKTYYEDEEPLPTFEAAECKLLEDYNTPGCALRRLAEKLKCESEEGYALPVSARWLSQLAEVALADYMAPGLYCTTVDTIRCMESYVDKMLKAATPGAKRAQTSRGVDEQPTLKSQSLADDCIEGIALLVERRFKEARSSYIPNEFVREQVEGMRKRLEAKRKPSNSSINGEEPGHMGKDSKVKRQASDEYIQRGEAERMIADAIKRDREISRRYEFHKSIQRYLEDEMARPS